MLLGPIVIFFKSLLVPHGHSLFTSLFVFFLHMGFPSSLLKLKSVNYNIVLRRNIFR